MTNFLHSWNQLAPPNTLLISPHSDDIALSLGGVLHPRKIPGGTVLLTLFTQTDFLESGKVKVSSKDVTRIRTLEDERYARWLGLQRLDGFLTDAVCRAPWGRVWRRQPRAKEIEEAWKVVHSVVDGTAFRLIIGPAGIGGHADHLICRKIAVRLSEEKKVPCYLFEDLPYALDINSVDNADVAISSDETVWREARDFYQSQRKTWRSNEVINRSRLLGRRFGAPVVRLFVGHS